MSKTRSRLGFVVGVAALLFSGGATTTFAGPGARPSAGNDEEFFIVSSVDAARKRLVLKRPSEVTVLLRVTEKTAYRSEQNRPLQLADLRAGDTVYVRLGTGADSDAARSIRKAPMTVEELHRRYLRTR